MTKQYTGAPAEECRGCKDHRQAWIEDEGLTFQEPLDVDGEEWGCFLNARCVGPCINPRPDVDGYTATLAALWTAMRPFDRWDWIPSGLSMERILRGKDWTQLEMVAWAFQVDVDEWLLGDLYETESAWMDMQQAHGVRIMK